MARGKVKWKRGLWSALATGGVAILVVNAALLAAGSGAEAHSGVVAAELTAEQAQRLVGRPARVSLDAALPAEPLIGFEPITAERFPNYLRAYAHMPQAIPAMANMARSVLYDGRVDPELKMAMGLAAAALDHAAYTQAHMVRLLGATERGRALMDAVMSESAPGNGNSLSDADRLAVAYARSLTKCVKGFDDEAFAELKRHYNEPQIVELTLTACFFAYFNRIVEPLNLPVEPWALEPATERIVAGSYDEPVARIGLLGDDEVRIIAARLEQGGAGAGGALGIRMANSIRAMARCPEIRTAWGDLSAVSRDEVLREDTLQHYVSNEVSYRNDCFYCSTHQVRKLYRSGISEEEIARCIDDDAALPERVAEAVFFTRKVTDSPTSISEEDYAALRETYTDAGAFDVLQVAARFNFMNRFTDGLRLPSEPDSLVTYERVEKARKK